MLLELPQSLRINGPPVTVRTSATVAGRAVGRPAVRPRRLGATGWSKSKKYVRGHTAELGLRPNRQPGGSQPNGLLGTAGHRSVGRLGLLVDGRPEVLPVNYALDGETVLFRTAEGTVLNQAACGVRPGLVRSR